eukprot:gene17944-23568_t
MSIHIEVNKKWNGDDTETSPYFIEISFDLDSGELVITIDAPFHDDPIPNEIEENNRCKVLYNHEVVELFIASGIFDRDSIFNPYLEIEIGPHGQWYLCSFNSEANFEESNDSFTIDNKPVTAIDRINKRWTGKIGIPSFLVPEPLCLDDLSSSWMINAFAIHGTGEEREYLAYSPLIGIKPNFHQLKSFVPVQLQEALLQDEYAYDHASDDSTGDDSIPQSPVTKTKKKIQFEFRPSTLDNETKIQIINKITNNKPANATNLLSTIDEGKEANEPQSLKELAQLFKNKFSQPEIGSQYLKHIFPDEFIVLYGIISKRKGWSYKQRMLILTSKPRLFYLKTSQSMRYKGSITWTLTSPINVYKLDEYRFDIELFDKSRTYHITDKSGSDRWVETLSSLSKSWGSYLKSSVGAKYDINAVKKAMKEIEDVR